MPGTSGLVPRGSDLAPVEEVVEADAGAGHHHAAAELPAQALGDADHVAVAVGDREAGGVLLRSGRRLGGAHCSVGPSTGAPSRTRARSGSTVSSDSRRASAAGPGLLWAMRTPAASRMARQTGSRWSTPSRSHRLEVEAVEDAQRQQVLEPLAGRRQRVHLRPR